MPKSIRVLLLTFVVFALPLSSLYYLYHGLDFYKSNKAELGDFGKVPAFEFITQNGDTLTEQDIKGRMCVVDFIFTTCPTQCVLMTKQMARVQEAFNDRKDILLLSHTVDPERDTIEALKAYADRFGADDSRWFFLTGKKKDLMTQAIEGYKITAGEGSAGDDFVHSSKFVLIDTSGTIRNYYDGLDSLSVNKMIVHTAMFMPRAPKARIKFKREVEK